MALSSPVEWPSDCETCQNIWRRFAQPDSTHEVNLGSFKQALTTQCHTHKPLVQAFAEYVSEDEEDEENNSVSSEQNSGDVGITTGSPGNSVTISQSISKLGYCWELLLAKKDSVPHHPGTGRILNPEWADVDTLKQWKKQCLSTHGATCENPMKIWSTRPAYLIDVRNKCLVAGSSISAPFVALSYTYGGASVPIIDAIALERLQESHALNAPEMEIYMSPVIQRAIHLTSVIEERYLWADALCIPHADEKLRLEELRMMGAIYANALITIIVADGDSQGGLSGLEGVSEHREMHQRIIPFGEEKLLVRNTGIFDLSGGSHYHSRAWTFQEYRMSPRKIIFLENELHWECQYSVWHEEMILGAEIDKYIDPRQSVIVSGFPDLGSLSHIITEFNETELRYDEDALPAISGLLSVLSRSFTGGFLYGLPEMFFERGLGWSPYWFHTDIRRRIPSERPADKRLSQSELPSWSWIGWQGMVNPFGHGEAARINDRSNWIEETFPITQWYTSNSPSDPPENRRRIRPTWFENRDTYKDMEKPLPPGWSRHDAPATGKFRSEPHLHPDGCGEYIFKHTAMPDRDTGNEAWYYPFPVAAIENSTPPFTPEQTSYLFCNTWGVRLWGQRTGKSRENTAVLYNSFGKAVGSLHLHHKDDLSLFPDTDSEDAPGLPVDLVVLYKSRQYSKTWNAQKETYELPLKKEDMYKVLWVEWKEGIAYRLASGVVWAKEWEKLDPQTVDLVLG